MAGNMKLSNVGVDIWCAVSADSFAGNYWLHAYTWQWCNWLTWLHARRAQASSKKV